MGSGTQKTFISKHRFVAASTNASQVWHAKQKPYINNTQTDFSEPRAYVRWTDAKWKSVLWSDESTF